MGTGNNDVGKTPLNNKSAPNDLIGRATTPAPPRIQKCQGAMSQQGLGAHGNECYPQKLVRLIGHRDPQPKQSWDRIRPKPAVSHPVE